MDIMDIRDIYVNINAWTSLLLEISVWMSIKDIMDIGDIHVDINVWTSCLLEISMWISIIDIRLFAISMWISMYGHNGDYRYP